MTHRFSPIVAAVILATVLGTVPVLAETTGGATLAGGDNGAAAKADTNAKAQTPSQGDASKGSAAATPAPGQSTEHSDGTMRAKKNF